MTTGAIVGLLACFAGIELVALCAAVWTAAPRDRNPFVSYAMAALGRLTVYVGVATVRVTTVCVVAALK